MQDLKPILRSAAEHITISRGPGLRRRYDVPATGAVSWSGASTGSRDWSGKRSASTHVIVGSIASVPLEQVAREGEWPLPEATVLGALRRGYDPVPRTARWLPFV
jgi:hypothetical protein